MKETNLSRRAYETPLHEVIDIRLIGSIAVTSPTEPIIEDPEEEI